MRKIAVITTLFVIALFAVPFGAGATGGSDTSATSVTCPLPAGSGSYVVDISSELMLAWDASKSTAGPVSLALPAGTWDVFLVSYDDHSNKTHQAQKLEQWYLQGWLGESIVFTSQTTPDLPETTDVKEFFVGSLTTTQAIDKVLAVHAAYPSDEPHSVAPLCAGFYPTGTSPVAPAACPLPAGPGVVTISTELMLAWDAATAMAGPVDFALPAGTWDVLLVSYDNHQAKTYQAQKMEQWYLEGWLNGAVVFRTSATGDLPEDTDYAAFHVGSITTATAIDQVKAFHYAFPNDEPHSVAPVCASFVASDDGETPDSETPDSETPGSETPDSETPDSETPDSETPDSETPDSETPDSETPDSETPGSETPGSGTPGSGTTGSGTTGSGTTGSGTTGSGTAGETGTSNSNVTGTTVAAGLEGNTAQTLQQLPLTGTELETAFAAIVALMLGLVLLRRARLGQARLERRAARVWRRQLS